MPLWISCAALELDSPMSLEQVHRVNRAGLVLLISFLLIQPLAAAMLRQAFSQQWRRWSIAAVIAFGLGAASVGLGLLIFEVSEVRWELLTLYLFG